MEHATDTAPAAPERAEPPRRWRSLAERRADAARARIDEQRARLQAERERLETEAEHARLRALLDEQTTTAATKRRNHRRTLRQRVSLAVVLAAANVGVNGAAVLGQILALMYGLKWEWWQAVPLAVVVESVAVNVGYLAHDKMIKGFSAYGLRLLSYAIGVGVGVFNYSHNSGLSQTEDFAGVFGAASVLSPVLWQIYSQWRHWETMREQGLLEQRPLRFPLLRWVIPSLRSETWAAFKHGVAEDIRSPQVALAEIRAMSATDAAWRGIGDVRAGLVDVQGNVLTVAELVIAEMDARDAVNTSAPIEAPPIVTREITQAVTELVTAEAAPGNDEVNTSATIECTPEPSAADLTPVTGAVTSDAADADDDEQDSDRVRPDEQDNRNAEKWIRGCIRNGRTPTYGDVAERYKFSRGWARLRVQAARAEMTTKGYRFLPGNVVQAPTKSVTANGSRSEHSEDIEMTTIGSAGGDER
ncbi:hypothetical protein [Streptosporangium longisporum]|uniref:DUF2637 domain-containing protein n=1 Tax=Streptosporangium longisporum TaxID=46187 RepID=A0ABP6LG43_9ACTN